MLGAAGSVYVRKRIPGSADFHLNEFEREVYLPEGRWEDTRDGKVYEGGQTIRAAAPIDSIPVFKKMA